MSIELIASVYELFDNPSYIEKRKKFCLVILLIFFLFFVIRVARPRPPPPRVRREKVRPTAATPSSTHRHHLHHHHCAADWTPWYGICLHRPTRGRGRAGVRPALSAALGTPPRRIADISARGPLSPGPLGLCLRTTRTVWPDNSDRVSWTWIEPMKQDNSVRCCNYVNKILIKNTLKCIDLFISRFPNQNMGQRVPHMINYL